MTSQTRPSRRTVSILAVLAFAFLPVVAVAEHGGHGGGSGGGHGSGGHGGGNYGGGGHGSGGHGGGNYGGGHYGGSYGGGGHGDGGHGGWGHGGYGGYYGGGYGCRYPSYYSYSSPFYYGYGAYGYWPYAGYYGAYSGYGNYYTRRSSAYDGPEFGAVDIDLGPDEVGVYEGGRLLGTADDFDGLPSYLWLAEGTHELTFYLEGYRTEVREVAVNPGRIESVGGRLQAGASTPPEAGDYVDERSTFEEPDDRPAAAPGERSGSVDFRKAPGKLLLAVEPGDASVYLDGRFLGTGDALRAGVIVDPGSHVIEAVRPMRQAATWQFDIDSGGELEHRIELAQR